MIRGTKQASHTHHPEQEGQGFIVNPLHHCHQAGSLYNKHTHTHRYTHTHTEIHTHTETDTHHTWAQT